MSCGISVQEEDKEYVNLSASTETQITNVYFANRADYLSLGQMMPLLQVLASREVKSA